MTLYVHKKMIPIFCNRTLGPLHILPRLILRLRRRPLCLLTARVLTARVLTAALSLVDRLCHWLDRSCWSGLRASSNRGLTVNTVSQKTLSSCGTRMKVKNSYWPSLLTLVMTRSLDMAVFFKQCFNLFQNMWTSQPVVFNNVSAHVPGGHGIPVSQAHQGENLWAGDVGGRRICVGSWHAGWLETFGVAQLQTSICLIRNVGFTLQLSE